MGQPGKALDVLGGPTKADVNGQPPIQPSMTGESETTLPQDVYSLSTLELIYRILEEDGMDLVARILAAANRHLAPDGLIVLEIGHEARHFERRFPTLEFAYVPVTQGDDRVVAIGAAALKAAAARRGAAKPR